MNRMIIIILVAALSALSPQPALADAFSGTLAADALDGTHIVLPQAAGEKPFVVVVAFDRSAKDAVVQWSHELNRAFGTRAIVYAVIDAAGAPGFVHGFVRSDVTKSAPPMPTVHRSNILITYERDGWTSIAPPGDKANAAVVVFDRMHHIVAAKREAYSTATLAELVKSLP